MSRKSDNRVRRVGLAHEGRRRLVVLRRHRPQLCDGLVQRDELDPRPAQRRHRPPVARRARRRSPRRPGASPARGRRRSACHRAGRARAPSPGSRTRCAPRSRARAAGPMPPRRAWPNSSFAGGDELHRALLREPPPRRRRRSRSRARARGGGGSACRPRRCRTGAPGSGSRRRRPASPEWSAIQPAWRPITSTTITRWWDSAVVCSRSIASVATWRAVSKPKVTSVAARSLSIVFGTPSTGHAVLAVEARGGAQRVLAADRDQPVEVKARHVLAAPRSGPSSSPERVCPRRAEDRPAARQDPASRLDRQLLVLVLERPAPAVAEADDRVPVDVDALPHDRSDRGVQPRAVAASGEHPDPHGRTISPATRRGIGSGGAAQRLVACAHELDRGADRIDRGPKLAIARAPHR